MEKGKAIVLTNGMLDTDNAKTCHGLLRHTSRFELLAVIDEKFAGRDAGEVLDGVLRQVPVFASVEAFFQKNWIRPDYCVLGVAFQGGHLPGVLRRDLLLAMSHGLSVVNGLHTLLGEDPEFLEAARRYGVEIIDIRKPRPASALKFWSGEIFSVKTPRIAVLGTDCAVGKRTTCQLIHQHCRENDIEAEMIFTGQTGWMQGYAYGFIFDATLNDFIGGEIERAIVRCEREARPDLILIEGQSALRNPTGPCGSEFILSGNVKGVILQHAPGRPYFEGTEAFHCRIPAVADEIELMKLYGAAVLAVALNEEGLSPEALRKYQYELQAELQIPVVLPLQEGVERLLPVVKEFMSR